MATFGDGESASVDGIRVQGRGVTGEVSEGIATSRGGRGRALDAELPTDGFAQRAQFTLEVTSVSRGTRGGAQTADESEPPVAVVDQAAPATDELGQVAVVDDGGLFYIIRPADSGEDEGRFVIPVGDGFEPRRGATQLVGRVAVRIIGLFAKRALVKGAELAVQTAEKYRRPYRLRSFTPNDHRQDPGRTGVELLKGGPALLLIHGVNSNSVNAFRFDRSYVQNVHERYGGRVAAFDHPSLSFDPRVNAEWLAESIDGQGIEELDILAHCRGGLVARELLAALGSRSNIVRSIVFAATPNNGTPLADVDRIDAFLGMAINVTAVIPDNPVTDAIGIALEVVREVLEGAVEAIDGITYMQPGSGPLRELAKNGAGDTVFRAIATHYEPRSDDGALRRAANYAMDKAFRGEANDLLVPTRSAYLPTNRFHVPVDQRLVLSASFGVSHGTIWPEARVLRQLDQWLDPGIAVDAAKPVEAEHTDPTAEVEEAARIGRADLAREALERLSGDAIQQVTEVLGGAFDIATARSRDNTKKRSTPRGTVVLLPGILGSQLRVADADAPDDDIGELVWLNKWALFRGGFRRLGLGDPRYRVTPDGLMKEYAPLFAHLAASWNVHAFAYDWRLSIEDLKDRLGEFLDDRGIDVGATDDPVHLVGHSMGGLVARAYVGSNRARWERGKGRLLQLGTPNWGSFSMVAAALGDEFAVRALAAADMFGSKDDILRVLRSFPSIYELFPSPLRPLAEGGESAHAALYSDDATWYRRTDDGSNVSSIRPDLIEAARNFHDNMANVKGDDRFVFVAGDAQPTPYRARIETSGKISFGVTRRGDGRVPHDFGYADLDIADACTFFVETSHGDLASDERVLRVIDDLLVEGKSAQLAKAPAGGVRGGRAEAVVWVDSADLEQALGLPVQSANRGDDTDPGAVDAGLADATRLYLGGRGKRPATAALRLRVVHGSMEQARYAVAAGRYKGIPIEGALAYLNDRLDDALRDLQDLDLLPEEAGSTYYVPPLDIGDYPQGAIVLGLGEFGQLSTTRLARVMERGTIEYALAKRGTKNEKPNVGVATVLIGTPGRYGLSVQGSILAMVQGVARAAARLKDTVRITELEIIELYEGKAEEAAMAVATLARTHRFDGMDVQVVPETRIDMRPGGRPGAGDYEQTGTPWLRVQLDLEEPKTPDAQRARSRTLRWVSLGRSSQADHLAVDIPEKEIRRHVQAAIQNPGAAGDTNLTLFEMLFPHEAKLDLDEKDNLHLLVDESTAWIPWEVVTGRDTDGKRLRPLALRAGVLRQLKPREAQRPRRKFLPIGKRALVIGDPPTNLGRLPGARREARVVADLLESDGYDVTRCIYPDDAEPSDEIAAEIRDAFFAQQYRIIHIAAHGEFKEGSTDPFANGVVIGNLEDGHLLTAQHFAQRLVRPDLVFLNCCHIGRIDEPTIDGSARRIAYSDLAASMSIAIMETGVRAVVAAGWAVNDAAASAFARSFYSSMMAGYAYGESVSQARADCYNARDNTWGAYQCYGDPDFQFFGSRRRTSDDSDVVLSKRHLVKRLEILGNKASDQVGRANTAKVAADLRGIEDRYSDEFGTPDVWEAFGSAYAEAGAFDSAVFSYRKAVDKGATNTTAMEQLANLEVRLAAMIHRDGEIPNRRVDGSATELCLSAEGLLNRLLALHPTQERLAIKGSLYKRWASIGGANRDKIEDLRTSRDAYAEAERLASRGSPELSVYQACLALQMAYLAAAEANTLAEQDVEWFKDYRCRLEQQRETMDPESVDGSYYERARPIDIDATEIIVSGRITEAGNAEAIIDGFTFAFKIRSSARERLSVKHHYRELAELLPKEDQRASAKSIADRLGDD
jgi:CHAT domain-containing protein/triacylglycerol esterase/lipase EstA (alpha/beta hydrolase family)